MPQQQKRLLVSLALSESLLCRLICNGKREAHLYTMSAGVRYHRTLAARQTSHLIQSEESPAGHREHEYVLKHLMYIKVEIEVDEMNSQVGI